MKIHQEDGNKYEERNENIQKRVVVRKRVIRTKKCNDRWKKNQKCKSFRKLLLFYHCSSCYCFGVRGIVSFVCSIVLSKGFMPFMCDLTWAGTWPRKKPRHDIDQKTLKSQKRYIKKPLRCRTDARPNESGCFHDWYLLRITISKKYWTQA